MFVPFLFELRRLSVKVGAQEAVALVEALHRGLHDSSLDGFYYVARSLLVHREADLDSFDVAFAKHFQGIELQVAALKTELEEWLANAKKNYPQLTPEERAMFDALSREELAKMFDERLREQKERHDGGSKWIGTGGKSPFGHSGAPRPGIRVGGSGGGRSAIHVAGERQYAGYRDDLILDVRQMSVALRKLKVFTRDGAEEELDLERTIEETAKNAGELEVKLRPPRRTNTRVILLMDVGGSMDPHAVLMSQLFSAASKATHFKELRTYYFHNCIYGKLYKSERFDESISVDELLHECGSHYKVVIVGDALMAPYELMSVGGSLDYASPNRKEGIAWLMTLRQHFSRSAWLNPEPPNYWYGNTIEAIRQVFDMFPLTAAGLGEAATHLARKV